MGKTVSLGWNVAFGLGKGEKEIKIESKTAFN